MSEKRHKCKISGCGAKFYRPSKLEAHLRKHTGERPFDCDQCDKTYTNQSHLRRHKNIVHIKVAVEPVRCSHAGCYRELSSTFALKKHINRHHNPERKFKHACHVCEKNFQKKKQLYSHVFEHTGEAPFKCETCKLGFVSITQYKKHKQNHKEYKCKCNEVFQRWTELRKHRTQCSKPKLECVLCNKKFVNKSNLRKHKKVHEITDEVYECTEENCERVYKYKNNLQQHIKSFHLKIKKINPDLKCPFPECGKILGKRQNYKHHISTMHPKNPRKSPVRPRKDKGTMKKSSALRLAGLKVPSEIEKLIVQGEGVDFYFENSEDSNTSEDIDISYDDSETDDSEASVESMEDATESVTKSTDVAGCSTDIDNNESINLLIKSTV